MAHCLASTPLSRDELKGKRGASIARYVDHVNAFQVSMLETPCACDTLPCCVVGACPLVHLCVQGHMRHKVLNHLHPGSNWDHYVCCQGFVPACCCFNPGQCGERDCPRTCMCCEAFLCPGCAVSSTRFLLMDHYELMPDPCDNRLIRINNCIQVLSCICHVAAIFDKHLRELAHLLDCLADVVFWSTTGCMVAQVDAELRYRSSVAPIDVLYSPVAAEAAGAYVAPPVVDAPAEKASKAPSAPAMEDREEF